MLNQITPALVRSLHMLARIPAWDAVDKGLQDELQTTYERMREAHDDVALRQLQGRAKLLTEILKLVQDTASLMEKFERK